mmetsp:Transcript_31224/g.68201  ORF Transcript_31224/g.68201 Transcript_31224/m.68201 type:complete len:253 (-) Transcript_31224:1151-1909(-)
MRHPLKDTNAVHRLFYCSYTLWICSCPKTPCLWPHLQLTIAYLQSMILDGALRSFRAHAASTTPSDYFTPVDQPAAHPDRVGCRSRTLAALSLSVIGAGRVTEVAKCTRANGRPSSANAPVCGSVGRVPEVEAHLAQAKGVVKEGLLLVKHCGDVVQAGHLLGVDAVGEGLLVHVQLRLEAVEAQLRVLRPQLVPGVLHQEVEQVQLELRGGGEDGNAEAQQYPPALLRVAVTVLRQVLADLHKDLIPQRRR